MYGKFFQSTFTGSMFGAGIEVFAVWGYVVANVRRGFIELNPNLLAATLGCPAEMVSSAITFLSSPDPKSRTKDSEGRRLIKEGEFLYRVVNFAAYQQIRNEDERKEYNRVKQRESRAVRLSKRVKAPVNDMSNCQPRSAHADADADADKKRGQTRSRSKPPDDAQWRQSLLSDLAYKHINISAEFSKWQRWCARNHKRPTQARFESWLNRIESPVAAFNNSTTLKPTSPLPSSPPPELSDDQIAKNQAFIRTSVAKLKNHLSIPP